MTLSCAIFLIHLTLATPSCVPSSQMRSWKCLTRWSDCVDFDIDPPLWLPRRVAVFVSGIFLCYAKTMVPPRAPVASCVDISSLATSIAPPWPWLLYEPHPQPWLLALQLGYLGINKKGYHPHELLAGYLQSQRSHQSHVLCSEDVNLLGPAFGLFLVSPSAGVPLWL